MVSVRLVSWLGPQRAAALIKPVHNAVPQSSLDDLLNKLDLPLLNFSSPSQLVRVVDVDRSVRNPSLLVVAIKRRGTDGADISSTKVCHSLAESHAGLPLQHAAASKLQDQVVR